MGFKTLKPQRQQNQPQQTTAQSNRGYPMNYHQERELGVAQWQLPRKPYNGQQDGRGHNPNGERPPYYGHTQNQSGNAPCHRGWQQNGQHPQGYQQNQGHQQNQGYQYRTPQTWGPQQQYRGPPQYDYHHQGGPQRGFTQGEGYYYSPKPQRVRYNRPQSDQYEVFVRNNYEPLYDTIDQQHSSTFFREVPGGFHPGNKKYRKRGGRAGRRIQQKKKTGRLGKGIYNISGMNLTRE